MVDLNASNNVYSYFLGGYRQDLRPCFAELTPGIVEYIYDENCKLLSSSEGMLVPLRHSWQSSWFFDHIMRQFLVS